MGGGPGRFRRAGRRGPAGNVNYPSLRLITCGGPFDAAKGQDLDNVVVYAHLIS